MKEAVNFIGNYEETLVSYAKKNNADGIICGHIHCAANKEINNIHYLNCGDWVESCTTLVETLNGKFELVHYENITSN